ncbi:MAG: GNAT family N-acetyltransferase [Candidatus Thorarchaeota archaeon]
MVREKPKSSKQLLVSDDGLEEITLQTRILEESNLPELIKTGGIKTIWQIDRLVDNSLANPATEKYINSVIVSSHSIGVWDNKELSAFIIGSIPQWDIDFFGYNSYVVRHVWYDSKKSLDRLLEYFEEQMKNWDIKYAYAKFPTAEKPTTRMFEEIGFTLADLRVTFNKKLVNEKPFPTNIGDLVFELAKNEDMEPIANLSKEVSKQDRFHSDPNVDSELADELYYQWIINGFSKGKDTVKCLVDGELAGFHMSYPEKSIEDKGIYPLSISDIMGVYPRFGGRGIGTGLFVNYFGLAQSRGQRSVIAGVHIDNVISLRLHEGVGFKAVHTEIGLRKWY